jgi:hypothetical protein
MQRGILDRTMDWKREIHRKTKEIGIKYGLYLTIK